MKKLLIYVMLSFVAINNANAGIFEFFNDLTESPEERRMKTEIDFLHKKIEMEKKRRAEAEEVSKRLEEKLAMQESENEKQEIQNNMNSNSGGISSNMSSKSGIGDAIGNVLGGLAGGAVGSVLGKLDQNFSNIFSKSLNFINACYGTNFKLPNSYTDACALAGELDSLKTNVCSAIGGSGNVEKGITGFQRLCNAKQRQFNDYVGKQAVNFAEWAVLQDNEKTTDFIAKFSSGISVATFDSNWDVNNLLKGDGIASKLLKDGKMKDLELLMDYTKSYGATTDPNKIKIEDIQAPNSMNDYRKGIDESIKNNREIYRTANPSQSAALARAKLNKNENADIKDLANKLKSDYDNAKIAEIGNVLATSDYKKIAVPTQEYVKLLRKDLQPSAIAQIRRQQAQEVAIVSQIEEKWERKYNIAKLLMDKEKILAQKFDEEAAKKEINQIANQSN